MMRNLREDCDFIVREAIEKVLPDNVVKNAVRDMELPQGRLILAAIGKAAWQMAKCAWDMLQERIDAGIVITKHGYSKGPIGNLLICEAGHPLPDEDTYSATELALNMTSDLTERDKVLFLVSGGGSALFEKSVVTREETVHVTDSLLRCGASIDEINIIRKRLSLVKGGRFAKHCKPASVMAVILSDVIGNNPSTIASGPASADDSTAEAAFEIAAGYGLELSDAAKAAINRETVTDIDNVTTIIGGSVSLFCEAAAKACEALGYTSVIMTDTLSCEAREAGRLAGDMAVYAAEHGAPGEPKAMIFGGETVVHVSGKGLGGRNQELALAAARRLENIPGAAVFSVGSDGTDGPTDAAGGYVDGHSASLIDSAEKKVEDYLEDNDAYHALERSGGLIMTGPTGTNVNDICVILVRPEDAL